MEEATASVRWTTSANRNRLTTRLNVISWPAVCAKLGLVTDQAIQLELESVSRRRLLIRVLSDGATHRTAVASPPQLKLKVDQSAMRGNTIFISKPFGSTIIAGGRRECTVRLTSDIHGSDLHPHHAPLICSALLYSPSSSMTSEVIVES